MRFLRPLTVLLALAVINAAYLVVLVPTLRPASLAAPAGGTGTCVPGDTNGDSMTDIADAVYLLSYLFNNGPIPVACAQGAGTTYGRFETTEVGSGRSSTGTD